VHAELQALLDAVAACERDAEALVAPLDESSVNQVRRAGSWSVAQCINHLTLMNEFYLRGWHDAVANARARGAMSFNGLRPTLIGRWFVRSMEPPVKMRARAIAVVTPPPTTIPHAGLVDAYKTSHDRYRDLVRAAAGIDVNRIVRPNAIVPSVKMRLATVLLVIPAHDRRHLWQAARVSADVARRSN